MKPQTCFIGLPLACLINFKSASELRDDDPFPMQSKEWKESQSALAQDLLEKFN